MSAGVSSLNRFFISEQFHRVDRGQFHWLHDLVSIASSSANSFTGNDEGRAKVWIVSLNRFFISEQFHRISTLTPHQVAQIGLNRFFISEQFHRSKG